MTISLQNKKIPRRIDSFSIEQALFFEPYQESTIQMELLQALRSSNLEQLKSYKQVVKNSVNKKKNNNEKKKQENEEKEKKIRSSEAGDDTNGVITDDDCETTYTDTQEEKKTRVMDLQACNQFAENVLHRACRIGICRFIVEFLLAEAQVALNIGGRFG